MVAGPLAEPPGKTPPAGFPRWAWWALVLATLTFAVPLASPWWSTRLRAEIPDAVDDEVEGAAPTSGAAASSAGTQAPGSTLKVFLHTRLADQSGLEIVEREVPYVRGVVPQIIAAVSELGVGSNGVPPLLPAGTRLLDVAYTKSGTAYVDFSSEFETGRGVGAAEERALVQGVVTTITDNFTAVRRVHILVGGKVPRPGHLDLSRPLRRDDPIFAVADDEPPVKSPAGGAPDDASAPKTQPGAVLPKSDSSPSPRPSPSPDEDSHGRL